MLRDELVGIHQGKRGRVSVASPNALRRNQVVWVCDESFIGEPGRDKLRGPDAVRV